MAARSAIETKTRSEGIETLDLFSTQLLYLIETKTRSEGIETILTRRVINIIRIIETKTRSEGIETTTVFLHWPRSLTKIETKTRSEGIETFLPLSCNFF